MERNVLEDSAERHDHPTFHGLEHESGSLGCDVDIANSLAIRIPIVGYETMEERAKFTVFKLRVEHEKLGEQWLVFRRYTDFVRLHSKIKEESPSTEISLPPKRWLRDNFETAFLEDRMKGLQAFVDSILVQPCLLELPTVRKFFCLDEPPVYPEQFEENKSWMGIIEDSAVLLKHKLLEKEHELEILRAELALAVAQRDHALKASRSCPNCSSKLPSSSSSIRKETQLSPESSSSTCLSEANVVASSSSSEKGSPKKLLSCNGIHGSESGIESQMLEKNSRNNVETPQYNMTKSSKKSNAPRSESKKDAISASKHEIAPCS